MPQIIDWRYQPDGSILGVKTVSSGLGDTITIPVAKVQREYQRWRAYQYKNCRVLLLGTGENSEEAKQLCERIAEADLRTVENQA